MTLPQEALLYCLLFIINVVFLLPEINVLSFKILFITPLTEKNGINIYVSISKVKYILGIFVLKKTEFIIFSWCARVSLEEKFSARKIMEQYHSLTVSLFYFHDFLTYSSAIGYLVAV